MPSMADRVKDTTNTTGTGTLTLAGAVAGFVAFSTAFNNPTIVYYTIEGGTEWEVGIGTFTTTLTRDTVLASSNAGALVNLSAGTKTVFVTIPGQSAMRSEANNAIAFYQQYTDNLMGAL